MIFVHTIVFDILRVPLGLIPRHLLKIAITLRLSYRSDSFPFSFLLFLSSPIDLTFQVKMVKFLDGPYKNWVGPMHRKYLDFNHTTPDLIEDTLTRRSVTPEQLPKKDDLVIPKKKSKRKNSGNQPSTKSSKKPKKDEKKLKQKQKQKKKTKQSPPASHAASLVYLKVQENNSIFLLPNFHVDQVKDYKPLGFVQYEPYISFRV